MADNLDKYLPEFDEDQIRAKLAGASSVELTDMLIRAYKEKRVLAKMVDASINKLTRIQRIAEEPLNLPAVPPPDELRRMIEDDKDQRS